VTFRSRRRSAATAALISLVAVVALATTGLAAGLTPPPPTPVPPDGSLSPFPSVLHTPANPSAVPHVSAPVGVLADLGTGQVLSAQGVDTVRPIASLTKIMTALIVLDRTKPRDQVVVDPDAVFHPHDYGASSTLGLHAGETLTVDQLLRGMLLGSANDAAVALAIHVAGSTSAFVDLMNQRAKNLGLAHTVFYSPNGLDDRGHSTARDLIALTRAAMRTPGFAEIARTKSTTLPGPGDEPRHIQNRNAMLWLYRGATGVKTGSTAAARYCLVATAERNGRRLVAVVLGAPVDAFSDAASLLDYGFAAFEPHTFVQKGQSLGTLSIVGGTVPIVAGDTIHRLVPSAALPDARSVVTANPAAAFPPAPGQRVGTLRVTIPGGVTVGTVPLITGDLPAPEPSDVPWWARAAGTVGRAVGGLLGSLTS
jgi:serine-type D-Ala-D-Ala carboxypeptidase (penicillin-binding protein 5/6)